MTRAELIAQARTRLATIKETNDQGVYAKHYEQDVTGLLAELERPPIDPHIAYEAAGKKPIDGRTPCSECGFYTDNIYCALCTPVDQ